VHRTVCAVVRDPSPGALEAVRAQSHPADHLVARAGTWHEAVVEAQRHDADWLWLLEGDARPQPGALAALLAPLDDLGDLPAPSLMASRVTAPDGTTHPRSAPWIPLLDRVVVIAAAQRGLVSLRLARWGSLLVPRATLDRHGPPRADFAGGADDLEWTARVLREAHGYLAPRSVVTRPAPSGPALTLREARDRVRMVRGPRWVAQEPVWFAFMLGVDLLRGLRRGA
jgi:dTDP-4-dehydrorhamnose reductase